MLAQKNYASAAAPGFEAPGAIVSFTDNPAIQNGSAFAAQGMLVAAGIPLQCDEPDDYSIFHLGLSGLDNLNNVDRTVEPWSTCWMPLRRKINKPGRVVELCPTPPYMPLETTRRPKPLGIYLNRCNIRPGGLFSPLVNVFHVCLNPCFGNILRIFLVTTDSKDPAVNDGWVEIDCHVTAFRRSKAWTITVVFRPSAVSSW